MKKWFMLLLITAIGLFGIWIYYSYTGKPSTLSAYDENFSYFEKLIPLVSKDIKENKFDALKDKAERKQGTYGIYINDLQNAKIYDYNKDELFYGASLYKIPIAAAVIKEVELGNMKMEDKIRYEVFDTAGGTGTINKLAVGSELSIDYVVDRLLKDSDNTAQSMLSRSLPKTQIISSFGITTIKNYFYINNTATPYQITNYFEELLKGNYININNVELLLNKMAITQFDDRIHAGLRKDVKFSHKIGNWGETGSWHDCGVVKKNSKKIIVCVMSRNTTYEDFLEISKEIGEFLNILF